MIKFILVSASSFNSSGDKFYNFFLEIVNSFVITSAIIISNKQSRIFHTIKTVLHDSMPDQQFYGRFQTSSLMPAVKPAKSLRCFPVLLHLTTQEE